MNRLRQVFLAIPLIFVFNASADTEVILETKATSN
jgi:hypothetical protein